MLISYYWDVCITKYGIFVKLCTYYIYGYMSYLWVAKILGFSALCFSYWIFVVSMRYFKVNSFGFLIMKCFKYLYISTRTNTTKLHTHHSDLTNTGFVVLASNLFKKENIPDRNEELVGRLGGSVS